MVATLNERRHPFGLVVTGEAEVWQDALGRIVGPEWLRTYPVSGGRELLEVVESGVADAAVLDDSAPLGSFAGTGLACQGAASERSLDVMQILRMIRRFNAALPVVVVTTRVDRHTLEHALRLTAFSVVARPLELEELLRQIRRMMVRLDQMLRQGLNE